MAYYHCALRKLCEGLKEKYPSTPIMFIIPYPHRGRGNFLGGKHFKDATDHKTNELNFVGNSLKDYCDLIREICPRYDIQTLDLYYNGDMDILGNDEDFAKYTLDGCHPSIEGHKHIAEKLYQFVQENKLL